MANEHKMEYLLIPQPRDREIILHYISKYEEKDRQTLVDDYNEAWKLGIVGSHHQALMYYALHVVFKRVFGKSPITFEDKVCLSLTDPISYENDTWIYQEANQRSE